MNSYFCVHVVISFCALHNNSFDLDRFKIPRLLHCSKCCNYTSKYAVIVQVTIIIYFFLFCNV